MFGLIIMIVLTSLAFNTMMFLLMVRIEDPLVPRAMFGILEYSSVFPQRFDLSHQAFPAWLRAHRQGRSIYLRRTRLQGIAPEGGQPYGNWPTCCIYRSSLS